MGIKINNASERLFADLCSIKYLKGFVFHSPKYGTNYCYEAGDLVLWIRSQIVVFEIMWRNEEKAQGKSLKRFLKRISEKRKQLEKDYMLFANESKNIKFTNELKEVVDSEPSNYHPDNFSGVIILDIEGTDDEINYLTYNKTLETKYPVSIFKKSDFLFVADEADTIPDLMYYLKDRFEFIKNIFGNHYHYFLNTNSRIEYNLMAFYKMNGYQFLLDKWNESRKLDLWDLYQSEYKDKILRRDKENENSFIIDELINIIRNQNSTENNTILHSWELAMLTRRARAQEFALKIMKAFGEMKNGRETRYFSYYNQSTECWSLFYFQYGGDNESFGERVERYCRLKLFYEMRKSTFRYSVFGYGFRKSALETGNDFDQIFLCIEDADKYSKIDDKDIDEANKLFGYIRTGKIMEFPED